MGSSPDKADNLFHLSITSSSIMALEFTHPRTEMSTGRYI
jgi:hypothetical protein